MTWVLAARSARLWLDFKRTVQVDLNRDFPDPIERGKTGVVEPSGSEQPETLALMHWIREGRFVVSASLHEVGSFPHSPAFMQHPSLAPPMQFLNVKGRCMLTCLSMKLQSY